VIVEYKATLIVLVRSNQFNWDSMAHNRKTETERETDKQQSVPIIGMNIHRFSDAMLHYHHEIIESLRYLITMLVSWLPLYDKTTMTTSSTTESASFSRRRRSRFNYKRHRLAPRLYEALH